ncbi:hypothetical protein ACIGO9_30355 [Nocardia asteroides]|uniref:DUF7691 family protein n=1 Tax=Nocardia asteroides TaxID=1824 RepID=UPI0037C69F58
MAYSVDIGAVRAPAASTHNPEDFFEWMVGVHADLLDSDSRRKAMRELFFGEPLAGSEGSDYGYALKVLCERFGGSLANGSWYPVGDGFFDSVRAALDEIGVEFDPSDLAFSGPPVSLPRIDGFPGIGHLSAAEVARLARDLDAADVSRVEDQQVRAAIDELHRWVRHCVEGESDLVTFYH